MKNQKGNVMVLLVLAIVAVLGVIGYLLYVQRQDLKVTAVPSAYQEQYTEAGSTVTPVENSSDLSAASASLDAEDTAQIDAELNKLNSASAGF